MRWSWWGFAPFLVLSLSCRSAAQPSSGPASKPQFAATPAVSPDVPTPRDTITETMHGVTVADPYRWLEDPEAPQVQAWMKARDAKARAFLAGLPGRAALHARLRALLYVESQSPPSWRNGRWFYSRKAADQEKAVFYYQESLDGPAKVLLDPNAMSSDGTLSIGTVVPSEDGRMVAYMEQADNADESVLKVLEVGADAPRPIDTIPGLRYTQPAWTRDSAGFFYTWLPQGPSANEKLGLAEIRYHRLGTDPATDEVFRTKTGDPQRWQQARVSADGRWLIAYTTFGWAERDVHVMRLDDPKRRWIPLAVGTKSLYNVDAYNGRLLVATNHGAPRWQILSVDPKRTDRKHWRVIVDEDDAAVLKSMQVVGGRLGLRYLRDAASELQIRTLDGQLRSTVALPGVGTTTGFVGRADRNDAFFAFSSFNNPGEIHRVDLSTGKATRFHRVQADMNPDDFVVEQHRYPSKDGTPISIFLIFKRGLKKDGTHPTLLYGYGGFNISLTPKFDAARIPWLEQGGVWAIPNLRGGGEYGRAWHEAGMLGRKQNVFDDFIAGAEWLVAQGYTSRSKLGIRGRSNGGLLVGAAMTQRPELFGAVVCGVPLLDMVRYHKFGIGKAWIPEYGAADDPDQFEWLYAYSPYHRVEAGTRYPPLLMLSADRDDRVDPMHARKFVAAIDHASRSGEPNILRIESHSGHGGGDLRSKYAERTADMLAFLTAMLK